MEFPKFPSQAVLVWSVLSCSLVSSAPLNDTAGSDIASLFQIAAQQQSTSIADLLAALEAYLKSLPNFNKTNPGLPPGWPSDDNMTYTTTNTYDYTTESSDGSGEGSGHDPWGEPEFSDGYYDIESALEQEHHAGVEVAAWDFHEVATPLIISIFMLFTGIFKLIFHHLEWLSSKVPESCMLIIFGTGMGAILHYGVELDELKLDPNMFMMYLLPPIVLEASYSLHDRVFFNNVGTILLYAVIGTVLNWILIGPTIYGLSLVGAMGDFQISFINSLVFSSFIVAVDPVAVLAIFQEVGVNNELYFLVFGESLLNDAVTIVLYDMMLAFGSMESIPPAQMGVGVASFFTVSLGGALIGTIFGILTSLLTRFTSAVRVVEPLAIIVFAYMSYLVGDMFHWSGLISMICCGLVQAQYAFSNISRKSATTVKYFMKMLSSTSDAVIFLFLGLELMRTNHMWNTGFALWALGLCLVYRLVSVFGLTLLVNKFVRAIPVSYQEQFIMWYGGLRGAVCFALCATLPDDFEYKRVFLTTTLLIIFFTVFIQGMTVKPFVSCCNISRKVDEDLFIAEEFNQLVTDHLMAGVEAIVGQFMGDNYIRQAVVRLNDRYLRRWLMKNPMTQEEQILNVYHEIALKDHVYHIKQSTTKPVPNLPDVDAEKADLKEDYILDQEPATKVANGLGTDDTVFGLQLAIAKSFAHAFHQRHDPNLTHDDDTDYLSQLQEKHKRIRETRRRERERTTSTTSSNPPEYNNHHDPGHQTPQLHPSPKTKRHSAPHQHHHKTHHGHSRNSTTTASVDKVPDATVVGRRQHSTGHANHIQQGIELADLADGHINEAFNPIGEEETTEDDVPITKL